MEDVLMEDQNTSPQDDRDAKEIIHIERDPHGGRLLTAEQRSKLAFFAAISILGEIAAVAFVQLVGIYRYGEDILDAVTTYVGWSAYSSGIGVGFALLILGLACYAHMQGVKISAWPRFASVLSKVSAAMLIETPLLGQVNTYTAMSKGLGAGIQNASLVGAKISEALVSTICGYAAFSILLVVYIFALNRKDQNDEGA